MISEQRCHACGHRELLVGQPPSLPSPVCRHCGTQWANPNLSMDTPHLEYATKMVEAVSGHGQDCVAVDFSRSTMIIRVADGAGGVAGSGEAAKIICGDGWGRSIRNFPLLGSEGYPPDVWLATVNHHLCNLSKKGPPVGSASAAIIEVAADGWISAASVGDCRAWIFEDNQPSIEITALQNRRPLLGEVGADPVMFEGQFDGEMLIAATDGLWKYAELEQITKIVRSNPTLSLDHLADALIDSARLPNKTLQDDIALAIVVRRWLQVPT